MAKRVARRLRSLRRLHADVAAKRLDVAVELLLEQVDVARPPELPLQWSRLGQHRPRAVGERLAPGHAIENEAQVPLAHPVAEEQEMAAPQSCRETDWD